MSPRSGPWLGAAAYLLWGFLPVYFKLLAESGPLEIVAHRAIWSLIFCLALVLALKQGRRLAAVLKTPKLLGTLMAAAVLVIANWSLYVFAVTTGRTLESALGYFLTPVISALLGVVVLAERLRPAQWVAFTIGAVAVIVLGVAYGQFPWLAVSIASSFGIYGLVKNRVGPHVGSVVGLTVETMTILPLAIAYLAWIGARGQSTIDLASPYGLLILASGPITAIPLLLFAASAARVSLVTIGMLQYIAPVGQFFTGWLLFDEPMPPERWLGFVIVWVAVLIFAADAARDAARSRPPRPSRRSARHSNPVEGGEL